MELDRALPGQMPPPAFDQYRKYQAEFSVSYERVVRTLDWAEPLAREALGIHSLRDNLDMGEKLQYIPVMTTSATNGGWGELMPAW